MHVKTSKISDSVRNALLVGLWLFCSGLLIAQEYEFKTLAGLGTEGYADGKGRKAKFSQPKGIAVDKSGKIYVADRKNNAIRLIMPDGTVSTFAGCPTNEEHFADGPASVATFSHPLGLALDSSTNLYVADTGNHVIRKITPDGTVSTFAGMPGKRGYADGRSSEARFSSPSGLAVDSSNNLYVADYANNLIRRITTEGAVSTVAGIPGKEGFVNGSVAEATVSEPIRLSIGVSNTLYFVEIFYHGIRTLSSDGLVSSFVGGTNFYEVVNGKREIAPVSGVGDIAVDGVGDLIVALRADSTIHKITRDGAVKTLAGKRLSRGELGFYGRASRDGVGLDARFSHPEGVAVDKDGNIYVADTEDNTIRIGRPIRKNVDGDR